MKKTVITFLIILVIAIILSINEFYYSNERDYTGLTDHCIPEISVDLVETPFYPSKEFFPKFIVKKSLKRLTDKRIKEEIK